VVRTTVTADTVDLVGQGEIGDVDLWHDVDTQDKAVDLARHFHQGDTAVLARVGRRPHWVLTSFGSSLDTVALGIAIENPLVLENLAPQQGPNVRAARCLYRLAPTFADHR
jgi:hypothetical protein